MGIEKKLGDFSRLSRASFAEAVNEYQKNVKNKKPNTK